MNTKNVGNVGEAITLAEFVKRGIPVYIPFGENERADLVAEFNGKLNKIQIKTSQKFEDNKITWRLQTNTTTGSHPYDRTQIDYFALYNVQTELLLLVPIEVLENRTWVTFSVPYKESTNQYKTLNYQDYLFDKTVQ